MHTFITLFKAETTYTQRCFDFLLSYYEPHVCVINEASAATARPVPFPDNQEPYAIRKLVAGGPGVLVPRRAAGGPGHAFRHPSAQQKTLAILGARMP